MNFTKLLAGKDKVVKKVKAQIRHKVGTKQAQNELCLLCACFVPICAYYLLLLCLAQNRRKQNVPSLC
jgi:hypothetical protein